MIGDKPYFLADGLVVKRIVKVVLTYSCNSGGYDFDLHKLDSTTVNDMNRENFCKAQRLVAGPIATHFRGAALDY